MILFEREKHEALLVKWYFDLVAEPEEFERLFAAPLRNLTAILGWANSTVKIMMSLDREGIRAAAWVAPDLSGAWFGAWVRKNWRGSVGAVSFINQCYKMSLETFPVLLGCTKQERLRDLHLALGYDYVGAIPHFFDGETAYLFCMTKESREKRYGRRVRENIDRNQQQHESIRPAPRSVRKKRAPALPAVEQPGGGSTPNGGSERADPADQPEPGRESGGLLDELGIDATGTRP